MPILFEHVVALAAYVIAIILTFTSVHWRDQLDVSLRISLLSAAVTWLIVCVGFK